MRYIDFTQTREVIEMTPCEELGYKVGDKFEIIANNSGHKFNIGDIASLLIDDASIMPRMKVGLKAQWVYLIDLKKITDSERWIEWKGGECPVEKGTQVDVKYRNGHQELSIEALFLDRDTSKDRKFGAGPAYWRHDGKINDIIAYRLSEPNKVDGDDFVPFGDSGRSSECTEQKDYSLDIITLISSVAPKVSVSDALEIAATLQEYGFKK